MSRADRENERRRTYGRRESTADTNILRPAEKATLELIANGHSYKTAAIERGVSLDQIHDDLTACRDRLGARSNPHAVRLAIRSGQLDP